MAITSHAYAAAFLWLATSLAAAVLVTREEGCTPLPIPIRIGDITLSNNQVARGLELAVGTPPQTLAFMPQWYLLATGRVPLPS